MRKQIAVALAALAALSFGNAQAQLGNGGGTYAGVERGEISAGQFVEHYVGVAKRTLAAESGLLSAFGLTMDAQSATDASHQLDAPVTRGVLEDVLQRQADAARALEQKLGAGQPLQGEDRVRFQQEVFALAQSLNANDALSKDLAINRKKLSAARGADATQAVYLSKALPDHVKTLQQTLQAAQTYASAQKIPVSLDIVPQQ